MRSNKRVWKTIILLGAVTTLLCLIVSCRPAPPRNPCLVDFGTEQFPVGLGSYTDPEYMWLPNSKGLLYRDSSQEIHLNYFEENATPSSLTNTFGRMVTVSPTGNVIAFVIDGEYDFIRTLNLQTGIQEDVLIDTRYDFRSPRWSPNGQYLAYSRANVNSILPFGNPGQIYLLETPFDRNVGSQLTDHDDRAYSPTWSPDSMSLAYILATDYGDELWVADINTRETIKPTNFVPCQKDPSWSPDSLQLAFTSNHNNDNWDIYIVSIDTGSSHNITNSPADHEFNPVWSPDGQYIAYIKFVPTSATTAQQDLFLWDIQNSTEIRLTNSPTPETNPQWSPDGSKISFLSTDISREWYLEIMNPDGTERTSLESIGSR